MSEHADKMSVDANQHTEDILHRSQECLQTLATNAPVGIYLTDLDGQCLYVNQKWCDMAGMRLEEALGNGWVNALHPDDRERVNAQWYKSSLSNWNEHQEYRFQAPNGKVTQSIYRKEDRSFLC